MEIDYLIIGGGIIGQAVAWELSERSNDSSILLLDKDQFSQATTSQSAALVTQGRDKKNASKLVLDTLASIHRLNKTHQQNIPFNKVGGLHIAFSPAELITLESMAKIADELNVAYEWLSTQECQDVCPSFNVLQSIGGLYFPDDGYVDGAILADSYGRAARENGVTMLADHKVSDVIATKMGYSVHVKSREKVFHAKHVIVCAGPWAASLLRPLSLALPVTPMRSIYWITESCLAEKSSQPICVVPYVQGYFRPEISALLFGIRDQGTALHPDQVPNDVHGFEFPNAQDGMSALHESWQPLVHFWPSIERLGLSSEVTGISSYSPDGLPVIGAPEPFKNLTVVSGCSGAGIAYSGGIAKQAVNHTLDDTLLSAFNFNRFDQGDAYDEAFRQRCLLARSQKKAG